MAPCKFSIQLNPFSDLADAFIQSGGRGEASYCRMLSSVYLLYYLLSYLVLQLCRQICFHCAPRLKAVCVYIYIYIYIYIMFTCNWQME